MSRSIEQQTPTVSNTSMWLRGCLSNLKRALELGSLALIAERRSELFQAIDEFHAAEEQDRDLSLISHRWKLLAKEALISAYATLEIASYRLSSSIKQLDPEPDQSPQKHPKTPK